MQDRETAKCGLCGEPMPEGEEMFKFHGYSGGCPKPPLASPLSAPPQEPTPGQKRMVIDRIDAKKAK